MAGRLLRTALISAVFVVGLAGSTAAYESHNPAPVESDGRVVRVTLVRSGGAPRVVGVEHDGGTSPANRYGCTYTAVEISTHVALEQIGLPPVPEAIPYRIYCGAAFVRDIWVAPADIVDYDQIARNEAERYVREILAPGLQLHHAPSTYAVTGAPSHHWITGWNGAPITIPPINPYGDQLDITLTLATVTWDHGDNTGPTPGDLGVPAPSSVQHTYTHRSTTTDPNGTYTVTAATTIAITYTLNGGPPTTVTPPLTTTLTAPIVVRELQAVLG